MAHKNSEEARLRKKVGFGNKLGNTSSESPLKKLAETKPGRIGVAPPFPLSFFVDPSLDKGRIRRNEGSPAVWCFVFRD